MLSVVFQIIWIFDVNLQPSVLELVTAFVQENKKFLFNVAKKLYKQKNLLFF